MRYRRIACALCAALAVLAAAGCGSTIADESEALPAVLTTTDRTDTESVPEQTTSASSQAPEQTDSTTTSAATTTPATTEPPASVSVNASNVPEDKYHVDAYGQRLFNMTEAYNAFLSDTVFVGDSICHGLEVYKYLSDDNVCAVGSVAARNIFTFKFDAKGGEYGIIEALQKLAPKYIVFSMGMNDLNLSNPEKYCTDYDALLDKVHTAMPEVRLFVASITPISANLDFNNNANIDKFNTAMREHLASSGKAMYVDISSYLKNQWNTLDNLYAGGDGIHLKAHAYSAILYQVCEQLVDTHIVSGTSKNGVAY